MPEHQQTHQSTESKTTSQKQATPIIQASISHPMAIIQRARINPKSLTHADVMQLQQTIGNRAVVRLLTEIGAIPSKAKQAPPVQRQELVQRQEIPEEEEPLQGKFDSEPEKETCPSCMQRQEIPEEEEPLQGKMIGTIQRQEIPEEEEPLQGKFENNPEIACSSCFASPLVQRQEIPEEEKTCHSCMQRQEIPEEEEPLQGKFENKPEIFPACSAAPIVQRQEIPEEEEPLQTKRENNTGMPDNLKAGVESLSGIDMSDVRVHYNSSKPAEVGALAYTQGTNIHVAPGQERHLPHEAWHVVQQIKSRVRPTVQLKDGVSINDDERLEHEADLMGVKASTNPVQLQGESAPKEIDPLQGKFASMQHTRLEQGELQTKISPSASIQSDSTNVSFRPYDSLAMQQTVTAPNYVSVSPIIELQRAYGSRTVKRFIASSACPPASVPITQRSMFVLQRRLKEHPHGGSPTPSETKTCRDFANKVSGFVDQSYDELLSGNIKEWEGAKIGTFLNMLNTKSQFVYPHAGNAIEEHVYVLMNATDMGVKWTPQHAEAMGSASFPDIVINLEEKKEGLIDITSKLNHILIKAGAWTTSPLYVYVAEAWFPSVTATDIPNIRKAITDGGFTLAKANKLKKEAKSKSVLKSKEKQAKIARAREEYKKYSSFKEFVRLKFVGDRAMAIKWMRDNHMGTMKGLPKLKGKRKLSLDTRTSRMKRIRKQKRSSLKK